MDKLEPVILLMPAIALTLVVVSYIILLKKLSDKVLFKQFVFIILLLAFILNFIWEVIQGPLYTRFTYSVLHIAFCGLASVADAIMVLLIYFFLAFIFKNPLWIANISLQRILILMLVGGVGAILSEMRHLALGNWSYTSSMPVIPFVNAGISPVLQFIILPPLIYYLSFVFIKKVEPIRIG